MLVSLLDDKFDPSILAKEDQAANASCWLLHFDPCLTLV